MKVAIIGATGFVGTKVLNEMKQRNHEITAIARKAGDDNSVQWSHLDVNNTAELTESLKGHDVVISAFNAGWDNPNLYEDFIKGSRSIQKAVQAAQVKKLVVIGGAGSLFVAPDVQAVDTPDFPKEFYAGASAARDYLNEIKEEKELDWTYFSPAFEMHPGITTGRTAQFRLGTEEPVFDANQKCALSVEDAAVAIADEVERPQFSQKRFTAGY